MKKVLMVLMALGFIPDAMAYDWDKVNRLTGTEVQCWRDQLRGAENPPSCEGRAKNHDGVLEFNFGYTTVEDVDGVPSVVLNSRMVVTSGNKAKNIPLPLAGFVFPVSEGKAGNYVSPTMAARVVILDPDEPLYNPTTGVSGKLGLIIEAFKGRPPTAVEAMFGKVIMDKEFPENMVDYQTGKQARILAAKTDEMKVKLFGQPLYGATREEVRSALDKAGLPKEGSAKVSSFDVYNSSLAVNGTESLKLMYDDLDKLGKATYKFPGADTKDVAERLSNVYGNPMKINGMPDDEFTWKMGRITVHLSYEEGVASASYIAAPFHIGSEQRANNAFGRMAAEQKAGEQKAKAKAVSADMNAF